MTGAENLKPGEFEGDILLNLDSEAEGELYIGCAGGLDGMADFSYKTVKAGDGYVSYKLTVKGLEGGPAEIRNRYAARGHHGCAFRSESHFRQIGRAHV